MSLPTPEEIVMTLPGVYVRGDHFVRATKVEEVLTAYAYQKTVMLQNQLKEAITLLETWQVGRKGSRLHRETTEFIFEVQKTLS